jgi:hypothetical protein
MVKKPIKDVKKAAGTKGGDVDLKKRIIRAIDREIGSGSASIMDAGSYSRPDGSGGTYTRSDSFLE